jgi:N6-L-threonylcarbamoyladenine synthase
MWVLGIESSCDETAAAVVDAHGLVLSDVVRSQADLHAPYGGVVPELASRDHMRAVTVVISEALLRADVTLADIGGIAVTARPGLSGALMVGVQAAKGIAWATGLPIVAVDHLVGHLLAVFLKRSDSENAQPPLPFVALLASGGHTAIYRVDGTRASEIREIGATRDDAAGEAFDKVAKVLGLAYPGGPIVDRLAAEGDPSQVRIPTPMARRDSLEFSFSGLKSFVARRVSEHGRPSAPADLANFCAAFQRAVVRSLVSKTVRAARTEGVGAIVLAGGVAANRGLRAAAREACSEAGLLLFVPPVSCCTDNAAMIAYAGALRLGRGERDDLGFAVSTRTELSRVTRKGGGARRA